MTVTVRGVTYTGAQSSGGSISLPAGTAAGDWLLLVLYTDSSNTVPRPAGTVWTYYDPSASAGYWQQTGVGFVSAVSAADYFIKAATSSEITAGAIALSDAVAAAALIAVTGDHLIVLPSDWNLNTGYPAPIGLAGYDDLAAHTTATVTYQGYTDTTALYVGTLTDADPDAAISAGTTLLANTGTQLVIATTDTLTANAPVTATMTAPGITYNSTGTEFHDAQLNAFFVREVGDLTGGADNFADALTVTRASGDTYVSPVVSNRGFTIETGEPMGEFGQGGRSAWWTYTPDSNETVTFDTVLSPGYPDTYLHLCTGSSVSALTVLAEDDDSGGVASTSNSYTSKISADLVAGTTYHIKVGAYDPSFDELYCLRVGPYIPPPAGPGSTVDCPPAETGVTCVVIDEPLINDNFLTAKKVTIATAGDTYTSPAIDTSNFTSEFGELHTHHSAWWKYTPLHSGSATFTNVGTVSYWVSHGYPDWKPDQDLYVYEGSSLATLTEVGHSLWNDFDDGMNSLTISVAAGHTYYIQLGDDNAGDMNTTVLTVTGPETEGVPPIIVDAPPVDVGVTVAADAPVRLAYGTQTPAQGTVVPLSHPVFSLVVVKKELEDVTVNYAIQVEKYTGTTNFWFADADFVLPYATNTLSLSVPDALPDGDYRWTAVITYAGAERFRSLNLTFTIAASSSSSTSTTVPVTWSVAGTPAPHLWFVYPAAGKPGDQITAVGQGADSGTVTVNGAAATVVSFTQVAATSATTGRRIDPNTGDADAEHFEAVFTVPDIEAPGGPVVVTS